MAYDIPDIYSSTCVYSKPQSVSTRQGSHFSLPPACLLLLVAHGLSLGMIYMNRNYLCIDRHFRVNMVIIVNGRRLTQGTWYSRLTWFSCEDLKLNKTCPSDVWYLVSWYLLPGTTLRLLILLYALRCFSIESCMHLAVPLFFFFLGLTCLLPLHMWTARAAGVGSP